MGDGANRRRSQPQDLASSWALPPLLQAAHVEAETIKRQEALLIEEERQEREEEERQAARAEVRRAGLSGALGAAGAAGGAVQP